MNKIFLKLLQCASLLCFSMFVFVSCDDDENTVPVIESVWSNMSTSPIQQVVYAYPGQTVSLRGSGFSGVNTVTVNGMDVDLTRTHIYNTDKSIILTLPADVATSTNTGATYLKVSAGGNEAVYEPFYVKNVSEQPKLSSGLGGIGFSSTILVPGSTLTITGENLDGVTEVYLPLVFDEKVKCEFDPSQTNTDKAIYVIVPDGVNFARGQAEIVMTKVYEPTEAEYEERLYSDVINFSN